MFKKAFDFLGQHWRKIFTFMVGLAFIGCVCFAVGFVAVKIYRVFVPNDIYTDPKYEDTLYGGSVYEVPLGDDVKEGSEEFFENYIENLIRQDMPDFDDPLDLNDEYIISYGIWQAITLNNTQGAIYTYDSKGRYRVPREDVEMFAEYCFDYPSKIDHRTVNICNKFKYNILNKTYTVTSAGAEITLVPDVIKVKKGENDIYYVTADCYVANSESGEDPTNDPMNFTKRVVITLQDMGPGGVTLEGTPFQHYKFLSMNTVDLEEEKTETETEKTDK